jgi:hypothetical protein
MSFFNGMDSDEREMLHDLINVFIEKLNTQRRLNEGLTRELDAAEARLRLLDAINYGAV